MNVEDMFRGLNFPNGLENPQIRNKRIFFPYAPGYSKRGPNTFYTLEYINAMWYHLNMWTISEKLSITIFPIPHFVEYRQT